MGPPWIEVACSKASWFTSSSFHTHQEHMTSPDNANVKGMSLWMDLRPLLLDVKLYTSQSGLLLLQHLWPTPETMNRCRPMPKSSSGVNKIVACFLEIFHCLFSLSFQFAYLPERDQVPPCLSAGDCYQNDPDCVGSWTHSKKNNSNCREPLKFWVILQVPILDDLMVNG